VTTHSANRTASEFLQRQALEPRAGTVLAASIRDGTSAYAAHFVVTAEELGVPLITRDVRLAGARPDLVKTPEEFCRP